MDAETLEPLDTVLVSVGTVTDGENTGAGGARRGGSVEIASDGSFEMMIEFFDSGSVCGFLLDNSVILSDTTPDFPAPDKILVIVERDGCEQRIDIEMNEDTVVDLNFPDGVIELIDPILVPPCPEPAETATDGTP